jgi:glycosyltransferase involved in cell wall biosynthesis
MPSVRPASEAAKNAMSLGIVQHSPTQFDDPLYRYMARESGLRLTVYYYGTDGSAVKVDPEMGREVGWSTTADQGYLTVFCPGSKPSRFARQVVQGGHDLIIVTGYHVPHLLFTALMAKMKHVPVGLRLDNIVPKDGGKGSRWLLKRMLYPLLFKLYKTGHPVSEQTAQYLRNFGFKNESIFCFPYGVDNEWFSRESSNARDDIAKLRAFWHLPPVGKVVCGVMKFSEREDPLTLVRAFKIAKRQLPDLILLLVGDGPLRGKVEEAAGEELGKTLLLPGYQSYSMLPSAYAASDLFVHTATGPWEVSVNEALACGLPVVASDAVGSAQELVLPEKLGYTFRHGDAEDLAQRILAVMGDPELLERARKSALKSLEPWGYSATTERLKSAVRFATQGR